MPKSEYQILFFHVDSYRIRLCAKKSYLCTKFHKRKSKYFVLIERRSHKNYFSAWLFSVLTVILLLCHACKPMAKVTADNHDDTTLKSDTLPTRIVDTIVMRFDSIAPNLPDSLGFDSLAMVADSLVLDSLPVGNDSLRSDTLKVTAKRKTAPRRSESALEAKIVCSATDSVVRDMRSRKMYYYGNAEAKYDDITLKANCLEFDLESNVCRAYGSLDSLGNLQGTPVFTQGETTFDAEEMQYNFKTKKGVITKVWTEESGGYINGTRIKRLEDNSINIKTGGYTTCNLKKHPHFQFRFTKGKVIPDDKIVTGPIYLTIEDIPLPLALPFALIPNVKGKKSGIIVPTYGESENRGFYLENGGYYWAINDHFDLQLLGDIYTRGSWALKPTLRYAQRYKFKGTLSLGYAVNKIGTEGASDYKKSNDFKVVWSHKQDTKAHPRHNFSADVNIISSNYNKFNPASTTDYLSNTFKSSVAFQTNFGGKVFLTLNGSHSQNTLTKQVTISLPEITLSANRIYPFQNVGKAGKKRWYKDLNINYTMNAKNYMNGVDSLLFPHEWYKNLKDWSKNMQMGVKHNIPINLPIKLFKHFTWTTSATVNDYMYFSRLEKQWIADTDSTGHLQTDTVRGFRNLVDFNVSSSLTTKIYGLVNFSKGPIRAIRHVFTPRIGFTYTPDFSAKQWGVYGRYTDGQGVEQVYNKFQGALFGAPSQNSAGRITYNFDNNLEIKVPTPNDTVSPLKKVVILDALSFSGDYDIMKDSLKFSYMSMSARTTLFKKLQVQYSSVWDPYAVDANGKRINRLEIVENGRLFHKNSSAWNFSLSLSINQATVDKWFKKKDTATDAEKSLNKRTENSAFVTEGEMLDIMGNPNAYVDWTTPWSLTFSYNLRHSSNLTYAAFMGIATNQIVQTLSVSGDISITPKWKITFQTGWDFTNHGLSYTSINIYRDLHCWEMRFNWIPIGGYKSWNFTINVKAQALQDLKLTKKKDFRDN